MSCGQRTASVVCSYSLHFAVCEQRTPNVLSASDLRYRGGRPEVDLTLKVHVLVIAVMRPYRSLDEGASAQCDAGGTVVCIAPTLQWTAQWQQKQG